MCTIVISANIDLVMHLHGDFFLGRDVRKFYLRFYSTDKQLPLKNYVKQRYMRSYCNKRLFCHFNVSIEKP